MYLEKIEIRDNAEDNKKLAKAYLKMRKLVEALREKDLSSEALAKINGDIEIVNNYTQVEKELLSEKELTRHINKTYSKLLKYIVNKLKIVPKNYYRNMWLALGMSAFGIPFGMAFSTALDNYGFIGIGFPIGMVIGMALGSSLDKKAAKKGEQLNLEIEV